MTTKTAHRLVGKSRFSFVDGETGENVIYWLEAGSTVIVTDYEKGILNPTRNGGGRNLRPERVVDPVTGGKCYNPNVIAQ